MMLEIEKMKKSWLDGDVCLHPTDTLPGLSFNPEVGSARKRLATIKGRDESKTCICLAYNQTQAISFWRPLPKTWENALNNLWPAPLSIIWQASDRVHEALVREDGTIAIRVPKLSENLSWMYSLLEALNSPFPTTSVNQSGQVPATNWQEASDFLKMSSGVFVPKEFKVPGGAPSTLIKITDSGDFEILREGLVSEEYIKKVLI